MWRGTLDPGYVLDLVQQLPEGSRTYAALKEDETLRGLTFDRMLRIFTANLARLSLWVQSNQGAKRPNKKPELIPIPGQQQKKPRNRLRGLLDAKKAQFEQAQRDARNRAVVGEEG